MKIAVFGATGETGAQVVDQALAAGHSVAALTRNPVRIRRSHANLELIQGNPSNSPDVARCLNGARAVIHCLGIGGLGDGNASTIVSDSVKAVLAAMGSQGVARIVCMSNPGINDSGTFFQRSVAPALIPRLKPILEDKVRMEAALQASNVEWIAVRMTAIRNGPLKPVRSSADGRGLGLFITAASAAAFLLACIEGPQFLRQTPTISN